jgi:hypothetical protein
LKLTLGLSLTTVGHWALALATHVALSMFNFLGLGSIFSIDVVLIIYHQDGIIINMLLSFSVF